MNVLILFISATVSAQAVKTNLFKRADEASAETAKPASVPGRRPVARSSEIYVGNLPVEYRSAVRLAARSSESPVILPATPTRSGLAALAIGSVIEAEISESLIAFPKEKSPVRALVKRGPLKGSVFVGEAKLEDNSKRIVIEFRKFRLAKKSDVYTLLATVLDQMGIMGLEGNYHTGETKYFSAELLAALAAGYADAGVERTTTAFGTTQEPATAANAGRKAVSHALSRTADRFAEKVRSASEYSILRGPISVQLLVTEDARVQ